MAMTARDSVADGGFFTLDMAASELGITSSRLFDLLAELDWTWGDSESVNVNRCHIDLGHIAIKKQIFITSKGMLILRRHAPDRAPAPETIEVSREIPF